MRKMNALNVYQINIFRILRFKQKHKLYKKIHKYLQTHLMR